MPAARLFPHRAIAQAENRIEGAVGARVFVVRMVYLLDLDLDSPGQVSLMEVEILGEREPGRVRGQYAPQGLDQVRAWQSRDQEPGTDPGLAGITLAPRPFLDRAFGLQWDSGG